MSDEQQQEGQGDLAPRPFRMVIRPPAFTITDTIEVARKNLTISEANVKQRLMNRKSFDGEVATAVKMKKSVNHDIFSGDSMAKRFTYNKSTSKTEKDDNHSDTGANSSAMKRHRTSLRLKEKNLVNVVYEQDNSEPSYERLLIPTVSMLNVSSESTQHSNLPKLDQIEMPTTNLDTDKSVFSLTETMTPFSLSSDIENDSDNKRQSKSSKNNYQLKRTSRRKKQTIKSHLQTASEIDKKGSTVDNEFSMSTIHFKKSLETTNSAECISNEEEPNEKYADTNGFNVCGPLYNNVEKDATEDNSYSGANMIKPSAVSMVDMIPDKISIRNSLRQKRISPLKDAKQIPSISLSKNDIINEDFCWSCRGSGRFICCDACPRSFHFLCTDPPLEEEEFANSSFWYCKSCHSQSNSSRSRISGTSRKLRAKTFPSSQNLSQASFLLRKINPRVFFLPENILGSFANVGWDYLGNYVDMDEYRSLGARTIRWNPDDLYGIPMLPLSSNSFNSYICHGCGGSALRGIMIECDFCPFSWHLDCLNPPMAMTPPASKKWMCPLHAKHLRSGSGRNRRRFAEYERGTFTMYSNSTFLEDAEDMDEVVIVHTLARKENSEILSTNTNSFSQDANLGTCEMGLVDFPTAANDDHPSIDSIYNGKSVRKTILKNKSGTTTSQAVYAMSSNTFNEKIVQSGNERKTPFTSKHISTRFFASDGATGIMTNSTGGNLMRPVNETSSSFSSTDHKTSTNSTIARVSTISEQGNVVRQASKKKKYSLPTPSSSRIIKISLIVPDTSISQAFANVLEEEQKEKKFLSNNNNNSFPTMSTGLEMLINAIDGYPLYSNNDHTTASTAMPSRMEPSTADTAMKKQYL